MKRALTILLILGVTFTNQWACTSVLVSGQATPDGRPILLKNRDTGALSNVIMEVQGDIYRYIGIVNAGDSLAKNVWGGFNESGFAIINTANYNLNSKSMKKENEGKIMARALAICASLKDFETLLDTLPRPLCVNTNFGVIDAQGGCAYYETGHETYKKYDVNDPNVAPDGYLIRTNFGFSGNRSKDQGSERYMAISSLMKEAHRKHRLDPVFLGTHVPRHLVHGMTRTCLIDKIPRSEKDTLMAPFRDYIPRYITASCMTVQGVKKGEPGHHAIAWTYVGHPLTTALLPIAIQVPGCLPQTFIPGQKGKAWMAEKGLELKKRLFPYDVSNGHDYINVAQLVNKKHTGILQHVEMIEKDIISRGCQLADSIHEGTLTPAQLQEFYHWADRHLKAEFNF